MKRFDLLSALVLVFLVAGACTVEESTAGLSGGEFGHSDCMSCLGQTCSLELTTCGQDPTCAANLRCVQRCPVGPSGDADAACEAECSRSVPLAGSTAQAASQALLRCRTQDNGTTCAACGKVATQHGSRDPILNQQCQKSTDQNACFQCEEERCCQTYAKYKNNPDAVKLRQCYGTCGDPDQQEQCQADCRQNHPDGVLDFSVRLFCVTARCGSQCMNGQPVNPCTACTLNHCVDSMIACTTDQDCNLLQICTETCLSTGHGYATNCPRNCIENSTQKATQLLIDYQLCSTHSCEPECGAATL